MTLEALEPGTELYAVELTVAFDPAVVGVSAVRAGASTAGWSVVSNQPAPGTLRLALAGALPVTAPGVLAELDLAPVAQGTTALAITADLLNEGLVVTTTEPGQAAVADPPAPVIAGPHWMCAGETIQLDAGAGYSSYLWSTGQTTQRIGVSPPVTTTYDVSVTTSHGCTGTSPGHQLAVSASCQPIVADGFETGDSSAWSGTVP